LEIMDPEHCPPNASEEHAMSDLEVAGPAVDHQQVGEQALSEGTFEAFLTVPAQQALA
jgi:hypothetical protein